MIELKVNALAALFQFSGLSHGDLEVNLTPELLHDPENNVTKAILFIYSLETFIPNAINQAIRTKDISKLETLGPFAVALRSIVVGAEAGKGYSLMSQENGVCFWRPAILNQRDLVDYHTVLQYRQ